MLRSNQLRRPTGSQVTGLIEKKVPQKKARVGDEGLELSGENAVKCGARIDGPVSVVASVVAIHPIPAEVLSILKADGHGCE